MWLVDEIVAMRSSQQQFCTQAVHKRSNEWHSSRNLGSVYRLLDQGRVVFARAYVPLFIHFQQCPNMPKKSAKRRRPRSCKPEREQLLLRLASLKPRLERQSAFRTAWRLLNGTYQRAKPKSRAEIVRAASLMVWVLERMPV
jgi:hypothetical protein